MKFLVIIALVFCYRPDAQAQKITTMTTAQQDSLVISQLLEEYYFKGIYTGDVPLLQKIYHPGTLLFGDVKGQPYAKTLTQYLEGVQHRQPPRDSGKPFKGEILDIRIVHTIAVAEVRVKMYDFHYHEFLSFHQIDGQWLIVNKMISDIRE